MEAVTEKKAKEVIISAIVRRVGNCPLKNSRHEFGTAKCKCYLEDLGQISYWHKNPIKRFFKNLFYTR
jgi:hypothetical protein